jgi:hypothetical protein
MKCVVRTKIFCTEVVAPFMTALSTWPYSYKKRVANDDNLQSWVSMNKHCHLFCFATVYRCQSNWSKGICETKSKQQSPCSNWMQRPVTSQADACTSQAYACMYCICPMTSQADACSYCMGFVVLISYRIYLYLQLLCTDAAHHPLS